MKERAERFKEIREEGVVFLEEDEEEEKKELPPICIPNPPSPLCCGFYSQPGQFWLSMGGFDAGFLYYCKLSEDQDEDLLQRQDEPFASQHISDADENPVCSMTFSSDRQLLLCGMQSGSIRVYPLQPDDHSLTSMQAYWALNVHNNQYGHLRHVRCSLDDPFVLTAGDDGNIFCFCLLPPEEQQKTLERKAKIPSPRVGLENEALALDIEDPAAYCIETAKQKMEKDNLRREAELKEHIWLKPQELLLDRRFYEQAEKLKARKVMEVPKHMAWEQESCSIALRKLQEWCEGSLQADIITFVVAIRSDHRVSTYRREKTQSRAFKRQPTNRGEVTLGYAEKLEEDSLDPEDVQAISEAKENISEFIKGKQLRVNAEQKKKQLAAFKGKKSMSSRAR
ncbi:hypothetical protein AMECASPLE_005933 [Ameca splendens]|uniref:Uncharacterized protein n=1 Tax=Ameca splendens TaxID=208324 RepID=A0ABV0XCB7_9TELE